MEYLKRYNLIIIFTVLLCLCTMIFYPIEISKSAYDGATMWAKSIFPTLFPFFVCSNMLIELGFAKFMGELLSPIMIPCFGISGIGSFPLFSGIMSGYPIGAKTTCSLYNDNKLNKEEAQRLIAFSNNCGPLFVIGVVGGHIFNNVYIGYYILFIHIFTAFLYGIILNLFKGSVNGVYIRKNRLLRSSFYKMKEHTSNNNKTFGHILSDSVEGAVKSVLIVMGFIVLFSVLSTIIELFKVHEIISYIINSVTRLNVSSTLIESIFLGSIEMSAGLFLLDNTINQINVMISVFIITFGGFSIHAQSISFISKTNLNASRYIFDKFMEGILSILLVFITYPFLKIFIRGLTKSVFYNSSRVSLNFFSINIILILCIIICVLGILKYFTRVLKF